MLTLSIGVITFAPAASLAKTTRLHQGSFGGFSNSAPKAVAVDQSNGDVYVADRQGHKVRRFDSSGTPKNFTAGPDAGTNTLTSFYADTFASGPTAVAVDNSGGPLDGTVYVADGDQFGEPPNPAVIKAFARSGAPLGEITEAGAEPTGPEREADPHAPSNRLYEPCALAVDQASGSLYVAENRGSQSEGHIWRYVPSSPSGTIDRADYALTGVTAGGRCGLAADSGRVYATNDLFQTNALERYQAADFTAEFPKVDPTELSTHVFGVGVDPGNGDIYANEGFRVAVLDAGGQLRYRFGHVVEIGMRSVGVAVKSAAPGAATKVYVTDGEEGRVQAYGPVTQAPSRTLPEEASFGKDGTAASIFGSFEGGRLAFNQTTRSLYVLHRTTPGIFGFDSSAPPVFPSLTGFAPLLTDEVGNNPGFTVDNSGTASAGNIYFSSSGLGSSGANLIYGFNAAGVPLGGAFPIDPAVSPGAPNGSPKAICGVAVDSTGNIWAANSATKRILEYSSSGASLPGTIDVSAFTDFPCGLTFDSENNLYVEEPGNGGPTNTAVWRLDEADGYSSPVQIDPRQPAGITVDRTNDHLFVAHRSDSFKGTVGWIDEYDDAGNFVDEYLGDLGSSPQGIAIDETSQYLYLGDTERNKVRVFGRPAILPEPSIDGASGVSNTGATLNGAVATQEIALTDCHFEYVTEEAFHATGFGDLSSGGAVPCAQAPGSIPLDFNEHSVSATVSGLAKYADYRFRLVASNSEGSEHTGDERFTTASPPGVEIAGTPDRTATTAVLNGRVNPRNSATTFHFEYGDQGPCDSNPCTATSDFAAGSDNEIKLVAAQINGLQPNTTYHYRLLAENGNPDGVSASADMTVTTRASDVPLSHEHFPGPPGSDRAYEQISVANNSGNPVGIAVGFSADGNRALYSINGGAPITDNGTLTNYLYSERTSAGWQSSQITPPREATIGAGWALGATNDLATVLAANFTFGTDTTDLAIWGLPRGAAPAKLFEAIPPQARKGLPPAFGISTDGSRELVHLGKGGSADPAFPAAGAAGNLYDIGTQPAHLVSLLPGDVPACVEALDLPEASAHWISGDGSSVYFSSHGSVPGCSGPAELYMRDIAAAQSTLLSGPVVSGEDCGATFIRSTEDAAFFWTLSRLVGEDSPPASCAKEQADGDVYRYDLNDQNLECVTCVVTGIDTNVLIGGAPTNRGPIEVGVAPDGSRLYFKTNVHLLPGAPPDGDTAAYRVDVATGDLAYVAPLEFNEHVGQTGGNGNAISADGSVLVFRSSSPALNPIGGAGNGGDGQYYRYDDRDRSLVCISCRSDSNSVEGVSGNLVQNSNADLSLAGASDDGSTVAFITSNPLIGADQNTPGPGGNPAGGQDVYEWRDGRVFLITDGLTSWPASGSAFEGPKLSGVSRSGKDVYFTAPVQYTTDALDGYRRLYDARIGGGIDFPPPPKPCPLEVCQGTPKGAPEEQAPGTGSFSGLGNKATTPTARCRKSQHRVSRNGSARCVPKKRQHAKGSAKKKAKRASDNRRTAR